MRALPARLAQAAAGRRLRCGRSTGAGHDPADPRRHALALLRGGRRDHRATAATTAVAGLLQFKQLADDLSVQPAIKHADVTLPPPGAAQTILVRRLRPPGRRPLHRRQHRHDDAGPARSELVDDQRAVDPARPRGHHPGLWHGEDQRRLLRRRAEPDDQDDPAERLPGSEDQPHPRRQLRGLLRPGRRDRLRVQRCRPALLQQHGADDYSSIDIQPGYQKLCGDQAAAPGVRPLPPHRLRHRAQRAPAGLHPLGQGPVLHGPDIHQPRHAAVDLRQPRPDRPRPAHRRRAHQPVQPGAEHVRPHDQVDQVPGDPQKCVTRAPGAAAAAVLRQRQHGGRARRCTPSS